MNCHLDAGTKPWGNNAGIYRISKMAAYVKYNMPFGVKRGKSVLTDEQAWDLAAYINSHPRPQKDIRQDWPNIATKPVDHPFGPFADSFSERQHKFGPFLEIRNKK